MTLVAAAGRLERVESLEALWSGITDALAPYGFSFFTYLTQRPNDLPPVLKTNMPSVYRSFAAAADPFLTWCCSSYEPSYTGVAFLDDYPDMSAEDRAFILEAGEVGFRSGLAIPVRIESSDLTGGFNLGTRLDREGFLQQVAPHAEAVQLFCLLMHRRIEELQNRARAEGRGLADLSDEKAMIARANQMTQLSPREREILFLLSRGLSRKECARLCQISPNTASDYIKSLYRKLDVSNRVEAVQALMTSGTESPDHD
ncbi:LuxR C-terminal-related transcriptional regulator [Aestuariibius insulae]|uniref:helix-turn-helix transcriptional regulator n=1 Tax=Aestuariibius insulae TaxID=2058287 RepID=UPI00345E991B